MGSSRHLLVLRVRTVAKKHLRSSMFTASFILVLCVKLPQFFGITKDGSLVLNIKHQEIVSPAETSFKMALTICQNV